jgi:hypothetical protein
MSSLVSRLCLAEHASQLKYGGSPSRVSPTWAASLRGLADCHPMSTRRAETVDQGMYGYISTRKLPQSISFSLIQRPLHSLDRFTSYLLSAAGSAK